MYRCMKDKKEKTEKTPSHPTLRNNFADFCLFLPGVSHYSSIFKKTARGISEAQLSFFKNFVEK